MGTTAGISKDTLISSFTFSVLFKFVIAKGKCDIATMSRKGKGEAKIFEKDSDWKWTAKAAIMTVNVFGIFLGLSDYKAFVLQLK